MSHYDIIKKPLITEKTIIQKDGFNQISFEVAQRANRVQIRKSIESIFNVRVDSVNTMHVKGKIKRRGKIVGKRNDWKKAVVKLRIGERIEFFEGV
jgi:large subunit ribosomal protein L23